MYVGYVCTVIPTYIRDVSTSADGGWRTMNDDKPCENRSVLSTSAASFGSVEHVK